MKLILVAYLNKGKRENGTGQHCQHPGEAVRAERERERERGREALLRSYCATSGRPGLHYSKQSDRGEEIFIQYLVIININTLIVN